MAIVKAVKDFIELLSFLTVIPIARRGDNRLSLGSLYLLPVVGLVRGALVSIPIVLYLAVGLGYAPIYSITAISMHYIAQGFLHADGFIDFSEAMLAKRFGVDPYKVLKDRYRGSYAIAIFALYTLAIYTINTMLLECVGLYRYVVALALLELWPPLSMAITGFLGKKPPEGMGRVFAESLRPVDIPIGVTIAILTTSTIAIASTSCTTAAVTLSLLCLSTAVLSSLLCLAIAEKVLGFINGDSLGFTSEVSYLALLISISATGDLL